MQSNGHCISFSIWTEGFQGRREDQAGWFKDEEEAALQADNGGETEVPAAAEELL